VDLIGRVFAPVDVLTWDEPLISLPDRAALALFLRGRGLSPQAASRAAGELDPPLRITKRGILVWARKR
jgi:hypothetical protein